MPNSSAGARLFRAGLVTTLLATCASIRVAQAEPSMADIAAQIKALRDENREIKEQNRQMKAAISEMRGDNRKTRERVRGVVERGPKGYAVPIAPLPVYAGGAVPTLVTPDKKFIYGNLTITPGGFLAAEGLYRTRSETADIASAYSQIPFGPQAGVGEQRFSARQSRVSLLIEGKISNSMVASGYGELDFLGSAVTSNSGESNSYTPRIRHLYATLDNSDYGLHVMAGQTWSLATMNSKGITLRNEVTPPTIDAQYVPGFVWRRVPGIRLTKDFNQKLWLSVAAESPQTSLAGCTAGQNTTIASNGAGVTCTNLGVGSGANLNTLNAYSYNTMPDILGKAAYEAKPGDRDLHLEGFGVYRNFTDRVTNSTLATAASASNRNTAGYGVGGGLIFAVVPKRLDLQVSGMIGRGIGTYGSGQLNDTTFRQDGGLAAIREEMLMGGLTAHVTPAIDVYAFGGLEQQQANWSQTAAGTFVGYGAPTATNSGCFNTINASTASPTISGNNTDSTCGGNNKRLWQLTGGFWDKIYKGSFGEVRVGAQYSYTRRVLFQGSGGGTAALTFAPRQNDSTIMTSLRYYPFQ